MESQARVAETTRIGALSEDVRFWRLPSHCATARIDPGGPLLSSSGKDKLAELSERLSKAIHATLRPEGAREGVDH